MASRAALAMKAQCILTGVLKRLDSMATAPGLKLADVAEADISWLSMRLATTRGALTERPVVPLF
ncbi:hypothetical protein AGR2A_Lc90199 [Agrobacterium genomosp. 2 str. CFBP 5494]|uniref:Uncharacterized protein n=1 Tax=Agrobacterium genomosp. 2 str. CFBP 5494 TaxID=1183436 RepID=A0A9W5B650_9HYPH|nr:hypothetical protein AGR2A_Lc90199 [Agrobacterium genomosp. 2 str. CFBP 5494]